jgi:hypothetical protein
VAQFQRKGKPREPRSLAVLGSFWLKFWAVSQAQWLVSPVPFRQSTLETQMGVIHQYGTEGGERSPGQPPVWDIPKGPIVTLGDTVRKVSVESPRHATSQWSPCLPHRSSGPCRDGGMAGGVLRRISALSRLQTWMTKKVGSAASSWTLSYGQLKCLRQ